MIGLSLQKEQISHVANKNRIATALSFKSRNSVNILSKKSASWGTISQLLVLIHVRWHPTLVMLEERWWGSVFWSFIYFLQISRYLRCIRSISAFCRWNNMVDDENSCAMSKRRMSKTKHHRKACVQCLLFFLRSIQFQLFKNKCSTN